MQAAAPVLITNARLIDGTGAALGDRPYALRIEHGRIAAVAPQQELGNPDGLACFDAAGLTVMPGMIDCHDHQSAMEGSLRDRAAIPPTLAVLKTAEILHRTLCNGFTAIRDAGGLDWGMKLAAEQGLIPSPRLRISVNILCQSGGHNCHIEPAGVDTDFPKLPGVPRAICDGPDACRRVTREMIFNGADWIKLCTTGGVGTRIGGPLVQQFSVDEVRAIVQTAHEAGKPVMCHAYGAGGVDIALEAGVDSIEHGAAISPAQIERMRRQGTWLVPTFAVLRKIKEISETRPGHLAEYVPRKARELTACQLVSFRQALEAGVRIALGTDLGPYEHYQNAVEFAYMVEGGMTPMQSILAGTRMAAECIGLAEQVGTLRPGKEADLIAIDGDPLADIGVLARPQQLRLVMQRGAVVHQAGQDRWRHPTH